VLARTKTHLEIYQVKGKDNTQDIKDKCNALFNDKGIEFDHIIITDVKLPYEIAGLLDQKAQFGSLNDYEKTRHEFDLRVINDEEELELIKQQKMEERDSVTEEFQKEYATLERELKLVEAYASKAVEEIRAKQSAKEKSIATESKLTAAQIRAETEIIKAKMLADGKAQSIIIQAENEAYCSVKLAEQMNAVADKNAEAIRVEGEAEGQLTKVMQSRRMYEYLNKKLEVLLALAHNKNIKIYGNQSDDKITELAAYRLLNPGDINLQFKINQDKK
jgi:hypothetical protein